MSPVSVSSAAVVSGELVIGLSDGSLIQAGYVQGATGLKGDRGAMGSTGQAGRDGQSVLSANGTPMSDLGQDGDFCIDVISWKIYGPKTGGGWGSGVMLRAPGAGTAPVGNDRELFGMAPQTLTGGGVGGGGGVSSISGTAPILISGTSSEPVIGISYATPTAGGAMSAADKEKLDDIGPAGIGTLQEVTEEGNTTTLGIEADELSAATSLRVGNPLGNPNWEVEVDGDQVSKGNLFFINDREASIYSIGSGDPQLDLGIAASSSGSLGPYVSLRQGSNTDCLTQHVNLSRTGSQFVDCYNGNNKAVVFRSTDNDQSTLVNVFSITGGGTGLNIQRDFQQSAGNFSFSSGSDQYIQGWGGSTKSLGIRMGTTGPGDLLDKILVRNAGISYFGPSIVWDQAGSFENLRIDDDGTLWGRSTYVPSVDRQIANKKYVDDALAASSYGVNEDPHVLKNLHFDDDDAEQIITFGGHLNKKLTLKSGSPQIPDAQHVPIITYQGDNVKYSVKPMYYRPTHWGDTSSGDDWTILGRLSNGGADNEKMLTVHRGIGGDSVRYTGRKDDSSHALATQSDITALKSTIHSAISTATDFDSLKAALLAALV